MEGKSSSGNQPSRRGGSMNSDLPGGPPPDQPRPQHRLSPELRQWALQDLNEEEICAELQELREKGGLELHEFIQELEQVLRDSERTDLS
jgi:hypothetical protein